jgi:hypothetical protein
VRVARKQEMPGRDKLHDSQRNRQHRGARSGDAQADFSKIFHVSDIFLSCGFCKLSDYRSAAAWME